MKLSTPCLIAIGSLCLVSCQHGAGDAKTKADQSAKPGQDAAAIPANGQNVVDESLFNLAPPAPAQPKRVWSLPGLRREQRTEQTPPPPPPDAGVNPMLTDPAMPDAQPGGLPNGPIPNNEPMPEGGAPPAEGNAQPREPDAQLAPPGTPAPAPADGKPADPVNDIGLYPKRD